ncbi:MAG: HNH endonuclease signature motif containing protein [Actinomycetota bacterium]
MAVAELTDLSDAMDIATKVDFSAATPRDRRQALAQLARLEAQMLALTAELVGTYDQQRDWAGFGFASAAVGVRETAKLSMQTARQWVGLGRSMRTMPLVADALANAAITVSHARRLHAAAARPQFADWGEAFLIEKAAELRWKDWLLVVDRFEQCADDENQSQELPHLDDLPNHGRVQMSATPDGGELIAHLDKVGYEAVEDVLHRIEQDLFRDEWKRLVDEHGTQATPSMMTTNAERRARALVEMAHRAETAPKDGKRPLPLVVIHIDPDTFNRELARLLGIEPPAPLGTAFMCELDSGRGIASNEALRQALHGTVRRLVYESPSHVLDYGREARLFAGGLRQAIIHAARTCAAEGCEVRASRCEIDHHHPWGDGGATTAGNGRPLCRTDHRHRTRTDPG